MAKGKVNKSLKAWVAFVKSVQKKYKLTYKDAIHKAKQLKDAGADWMKSAKMKGGDDGEMEDETEMTIDSEGGDEEPIEMGPSEEGEATMGGRRKRRRTRRRRGSRRNKSRRMGKSFKRTMSRRRSNSRKASRSMGMVLGVA